MKATGIFVIILSQDGFESDCLEISFKQSLPKVSSEAFFKIDSVKNLNTVENRKTPVLESLSNKIANLKAENLLKRDSNTVVFLCMLRKF